MRKGLERVVHAGEGCAERAQELRGMRRSPGHADAIHPSQQPDEARRAIGAGDGSDGGSARSGNHAREFESGGLRAEKAEEAVLEVENGGRFFLVGDLEDELRARGIAQVEILIALTGERLGKNIQAVKFMREPGSLFGGEAGRFVNPGHKDQGNRGVSDAAHP